MAASVPKQENMASTSSTSSMARLCTECGRLFKSRNHIHGEAAREACSQCGKLFATRQQVILNKGRISRLLSQAKMALERHDIHLTDSGDSRCITNYCNPC
ncbi:hypothetical protein DPMN_043300 [Dreissena polymorpha]|uniref:Uncharacterized protein n=1 Tax=Dreissena polymorpha TaxID=45954 RepID=A0A9D4D0Q5_DREPO|nr:hypothetical protein DPMN_043300 [Dreissena polymorpha]